MEVDVTEILRFAQNDTNMHPKKRLGGRRNGRWQESCNPLCVEVQIVICMVAGVYAVSGISM